MRITSWTQHKPAPALFRKEGAARRRRCFVKTSNSQNTRHAKIRRDHSDVRMISRATLFAKEGFRSYFRVVLQPVIGIFNTDFPTSIPILYNKL